jgi:hypothetical protein
MPLSFSVFWIQIWYLCDRIRLILRAAGTRFESSNNYFQTLSEIIHYAFLHSPGCEILTEFSMDYLKWGDYTGDISVEGRGNENGCCGLWIRLIWLRIRTSGGLFWTRHPASNCLLDQWYSTFFVRVPPRYNFSSTLYPQSRWFIIRVIRSI